MALRAGARAQRACLPVGAVGGGGRGAGRREGEEREERREEKRGGGGRRRRGFAGEARRRRTLGAFCEAYRAVVSMGVSGG